MLEPRPQYRCDNLRRAQAVAASPNLNGIDFLEVVDGVLADGSLLRQRVLLVHLFKPVPAGFGATNVRIQGGVRITNIGVLWAVSAADLIAGTPPAAVVPPAERTELLGPLAAEIAPADRDHVLIVRTSTDGDFSPYDLLLVTTNGDAPAAGFDPQLFRVRFSFKVDCPSDFDCATITPCPPEAATVPAIDYLAKDYDSFRSLMLGRLSTTIPGWTERSPADVGVTIVELLAYAADQLSYFQDAVANEAYLGTARQRASVRRHARLLDYTPREGSNARAFLHVDVADTVHQQLLPGHTPVLTAIGLPARVDPGALEGAVAAGAQVFETMDDVLLDSVANQIALHTWGDDHCCLPTGATSATLADPTRGLVLGAGDLLALVEVRGADTGLPADADPRHRHVVRLTSVTPSEDPLFRGSDPADPRPLRVLDVTWAEEDALPFPLCISAAVSPTPLSVARGNIVLVDHGRSVSEPLPPFPARGPFRPRLQQGPIAFQGQVPDGSGGFVLFDPTASAAAALSFDLHRVRPAVTLFPVADGPCGAPVHTQVWTAERDLLASDGQAEVFVVETQNDATAVLRFGDGQFGKIPDVPLLACYRVGNGTSGNVGADTLVTLVTTVAGVTAVSNVLPATGGSDPEPLDETRLSAPQAFRIQERAVTDADYTTVAARHPEVQRAVATRRFTGSWYTIFIAVDRRGGRPVDDSFKEELRAFFDRFRMTGYDLEIEAGIPVPLDIALTICVKPAFFRADVKAAVLDELSNRDLPGGRRGFFHPDNLTFGQPVFFSQLLGRVLAVPGVATVDTRPGALLTFQRLGRAPAGEIAAGVLPIDRLEIAQLDNDPNQPEHGRLQLVMQGGL